MDDQAIRARINELTVEKKDLRRQVGEGSLDSDEERARVAEADAEIDRMWDLLRQRDAKQEFGQNPDHAHERSSRTVDSYLE